MAEIYKWIEANGKVQFSDQKPEFISRNIISRLQNTISTQTNGQK